MACLADDPAARPTAAALAATLEPLVDALPRPRLGLFRPGGRRADARRVRALSRPAHGGLTTRA